MKPMLQFTCVPPRAGEKPKRRRRKVRSPENPQVRSVALTGLFSRHEGEDDSDFELAMRGVNKWVRESLTCVYLVTRLGGKCVVSYLARRKLLSSFL